MYLVYKHTSPSGKAYIGLTGDYNQRCSQHRYEHSGSIAFANAIKKYGWDNFLHEILYDKLTLGQANFREQQAINEHGSMFPYGYNLTEGGKVCVASAVTRERISAAKRANMTAEVRARISAGRLAANIKHTDATKKLLSEQRRGVKQTEATKQKRATILTGGRQLNRKANTWIVTSPVGDVYTVHNMKMFADQHDLNHNAMSLVANGKYKHHRGWLVKVAHTPLILSDE